MRRNLLHKIMDGVDILLFNFITQCRNKRNLFSLYFGTRTHFLIKLFPDVGIIISAQQREKHREKGNQRNKQLNLERNFHNYHAR